MAKLLLVAQDSQRRIDVSDRLAEEGHRVETASVADVAADPERGIDLVVLDLPGREGHRACRELRRGGFEGVIVLIAHAPGARERTLALKLGADDVLERPFEMIELVARVEACLRRAPALSVAPPVRRFGEIAVDLSGGRVWRSGRAIPMSPRELQLLRCLVEHAGTPVSRVALLDYAWGRDAMPGPQTVDVHVAWLRRKLEADPQRPTLIRTVHGIGYVLSEP